MANLTRQIRFTGKLRDGFLVLAGVIYLLGYAVWAMNAWVENLGLLPAFQAQYFVAGLPPAVIICGAIWVVAILLRLHRAISGIESVIDLVLTLMRSDLSVTLGFVYAIAISILIAILAILSYVLVVYPILPQEAGGLQPRCAYVDFARKDLAVKTLQVLASQDYDPRAEILQSQPVDVFFVSGDFMLVKPHTQRPNLIRLTFQALGGHRTKTYQLKKEMMQAITWGCD